MIIVNYQESMPQKGDLVPYDGNWYRITITGRLHYKGMCVNKDHSRIFTYKRLHKGFRDVSFDYFKENYPEYYI